MSEVLFVSRGRSLIIDDVTRGQGEMVTLPPDEAERLTSLGFVQETPPNLAPVGMQAGPRGA